MAGAWIEERLLAELGHRIVNITERTRQKVIVAVERGIADGLGAAELGKVVEDIAGFRPYRAEVIARTETNRVLNLSQLESFRASGITQVMAIDGDEDAECAARNGQTYSLEEALAIEDHPNGTLDWVPMALGTDPKVSPPAPPAPNTPAIPKRTLARGPFTSKPKPEPAAKRSRAADPIENINTAEDLSGYLFREYKSPVVFEKTQARLWKGPELREVGEAFRGVSDRLGNKFPAGTVQGVKFSASKRGKEAASMTIIGNQMTVKPSLRTGAKRGPWGATKDFGDTKQVRKTITHEIGHAIHNTNPELLHDFTENAFRVSVAKPNIPAMEAQLAVYVQRGEAAVRAGRTDYYVRPRQELERKIAEAKAQPAGGETYISEYGRTSPREDFADSFFAYIWHPERLRAEWPNRHAIFEKYLGKGD